MTLTDYFISNVQLQKEWSYDRNTISTDDLTPHTRTKVWWQCSEGHVWHAAIYSRTRKKGSGCPVCAGTVRQKEPIKRKTIRPAVHTGASVRLK